MSVIKLDPPQQLTFSRPVVNGATVNLKLSNPLDVMVAFKVKTTAPKQYCVRPNSGMIPANQSIEVSVLLQPLKIEPPANFRCKDKFLVQCVAIAADEATMTPLDLWIHVEKTRKADVSESKLRCVYLDPDSGAHDGPLEALTNASSVEDTMHKTLPRSVSSSNPFNADSISSTPELKGTFMDTSPALLSALTTPLLSVQSKPPLAVLNSEMQLSSNMPSLKQSAVPVVDVVADTIVLPVVPALADVPSIGIPVATPSALGGEPPKQSVVSPAALSVKSASDGNQSGHHNEKPLTTHSLEDEVKRLKEVIKERDTLILRLQSQPAELRKRDVSTGEPPVQVVTKTVVNPPQYPPQLVFIVSIICFFIGVLVF